MYNFAMSLNDFQQRLKEVVMKLNENNIFYVLGERTGLYVQGVNVELDNEIDICTNSESMKKLKQLFENLQKYLSF